MSQRRFDLFASHGRPPAPDPGSGSRDWSVSELNRELRSCLEGNFHRLWVTGEVANFRRYRSGHCYFTLKDRRAQLKCVMFRRDARRLPTDPEEGMTLRIFGDVTLYEARGNCQFVARRLEADRAEGMWKLAFDRLRARLDAEGLTDSARKRAIPEFPRTVGVVTSPSGAALRDIVAVTRRRAPWLRLLVRGTSVQGPGSGDEIAAAISALADRNVDVMVVARGGGSIEDLWGFNVEAVARAVAQCPVPVVSGVGHETDITICDLVADLRAATPSAAAEAVAPDGESLFQRLALLRQRLGRALAQQARLRRWRLERGRDDLLAGVRGRVAGYRSRLEPGRLAMSEAVRRRVAGRRARLEKAAAGLEARSPVSTLARGYAVPLDDRGALLRRAEDFRPARRFRLRIVDGIVPCQVEGEGLANMEDAAAGSGTKRGSTDGR